MRCAAALILALAFLLLGTGTLEYLHNLDHAREDAIEAAADSQYPDQHHHQHDENNCEVHAQLHMPTLPVAWVGLLIVAGAFVAFLTMIAPELVGQAQVVWIQSRGPPVR